MTTTESPVEVEEITPPDNGRTRVWRVIRGGEEYRVWTGFDEYNQCHWWQAYEHSYGPHFTRPMSDNGECGEIKRSLIALIKLTK